MAGTLVLAPISTKRARIAELAELLRKRVGDGVAVRLVGSGQTTSTRLANPWFGSRMQ
jgi:hypothetical protein